MRWDLPRVRYKSTAHITSPASTRASVLNLWRTQQREIIQSNSSIPLQKPTPVCQIRSFTLSNHLSSLHTLNSWISVVLLMIFIHASVSHILEFKSIPLIPTFPSSYFCLPYITINSGNTFYTHLHFFFFFNLSLTSQSCQFGFCPHHSFF